MSLLDAAFESMSARAGTGFTLPTNIEDWPRILLFWIGGLGIIVFTLMIASRSSSVVRGPYRLKGHLESFMPSVIEATFQMWKIYVVLTVLFLSPFLSSWQLV